MERRSTATQLPFQQLLEKNDTGLIENPLRRIHEDKLEEEIRHFHQEYDLGNIVDVDVLVLGGRVAQDEEAVQIEGDLNAVQLSALEKEKTSKIWDESKELRIILLTCKSTVSWPT